MNLTVDEMRVVRDAICELRPIPTHPPGCAKCEARASLRAKVEVECANKGLKLPPRWEQ